METKILDSLGLMNLVNLSFNQMNPDLATTTTVTERFKASPETFPPTQRLTFSDQYTLVQNSNISFVAWFELISKILFDPNDRLSQNRTLTDVAAFPKMESPEYFLNWDTTIQPYPPRETRLISVKIEKIQSSKPIPLEDPFI